LLVITNIVKTYFPSPSPDSASLNSLTPGARCGPRGRFRRPEGRGDVRQDGKPSSGVVNLWSA
ncbi:MAG TPA: hypothetical protein VMH03_08600, partial [Terriglobales bacterium]|nr:hypothetical protein [Terriglobales bacterium]